MFFLVVFYKKRANSVLWMEEALRWTPDFHWFGLLLTLGIGKNFKKTQSYDSFWDVWHWHKPCFNHRESLSCSRDCSWLFCSSPVTPKRNCKGTFPTTFCAYSLLPAKLSSDSSGYADSNYSTPSSALGRKFKIECPYSFLLRLWPSSQALSSVLRCTSLSPVGEETPSSLICEVATAPWREKGTPRDRTSAGLFWAPSLWLLSLLSVCQKCLLLSIGCKRWEAEIQPD